MTPTLTVVLPVHNAEASLRRHVTDVLETAGELTDGFRVLIVDDGSSDDTFDLAVELSARYPQVDVMRNARQRGIGPTLRSVRSEVSSDVVVVHDGTSPIDANQIRRLWSERQRPTARATYSADTVSASDLKLATTTHAAMAAAHSQLLGFQLISVEPGAPTNGALTRRESPKQQGVGVIPPLPRPNFLGALTNFALGE